MVEIKKGVQTFKKALMPLFFMCLPYFWDEDNKLISDSVYKEIMIKARSDRSKFKDMIKGLKGTVVVNKIRDYFQLPILFKEIKSKLHTITHDPLIQLDVMVKEMMDAPVPNDVAWKEVQSGKAGVGDQSSYMKHICY